MNRDSAPHLAIETLVVTRCKALPELEVYELRVKLHNTSRLLDVSYKKDDLDRVVKYGNDIEPTTVRYLWMTAETRDHLLSIGDKVKVDFDRHEKIEGLRRRIRATIARLAWNVTCAAEDEEAQQF